MSYFPESICPSNMKQLSDDVEGDSVIVSGADYNLHDEEIRAIEKFIGVPTLPVPGESAPLSNPCSISDVLTTIINQLANIRDNMIFPTSGVVAVTDDSVMGVDGKINFPSSWPTTTLVDDLQDSTLNDEDTISPVSSLAVSDVSGMPNEGYITIINDSSLSSVQICHSFSLQIYSPNSVNAKVGVIFSYDIKASSEASFTVSGLPLGLSLNGSQISGTPTVAGLNKAVITATASNGTINFNLTINVVDANTPSFINLPASATAVSQSIFRYGISYNGVINSISATSLPGGLTVFGTQVNGTPVKTGTFDIPITISDEFGDSATQILTLTVT